MEGQYDIRVLNRDSSIMSEYIFRKPTFSSINDMYPSDQCGTSRRKLAPISRPVARDFSVTRDFSASRESSVEREEVCRLKKECDRLLFENKIMSIRLSLFRDTDIKYIATFQSFCQKYLKYTPRFEFRYKKDKQITVTISFHGEESDGGKFCITGSAGEKEEALEKAAENALRKFKHSDTLLAKYIIGQ